MNIPRASIATITGSPFWGLSIQEVLSKWGALGIAYEPMPNIITPFGPAPTGFVLTTANKRSVLWFPSYGMETGRDWKYTQTQEKVYWVLREAGVKILIVGGTSGITESNHTNDEIQPGDFVLPWSFKTREDMRGLPGTDLEVFWPKRDITLTNPFSPGLQTQMVKIAMKYVGGNGFRKIITPNDVRVALVTPESITFETDFDILMWRAIISIASQLEPNKPRIATLHGDCFNPILARALGIQIAYYHLVANFAQGTQQQEIVDTLYPLTLTRFLASVAFEAELMQTLTPVGNENYVHIAPDVFNKSVVEGQT